MSISRVLSFSFTIYGDNTSTNYSVDIGPYLKSPGNGVTNTYVEVNNFQVLLVQQQLQVFGSGLVSTPLSYSLSGTILTVTFLTPPPPYAFPATVNYPSLMVAVSF